MPNCNPITISNCPPVNDCDACKEIVNAKCVKYTGNNLTCIDVTKNENLEQILIDINSAICELSASGGTGACNCTPQACVKLNLLGQYTIPGDNPKTVNYYNFFSCSATNIPGDCTKTYSIFDLGGNELFSGTLTQCYNYRSSLENGEEYYITEYITCTNGSSESMNTCFEILLTEPSGNIVLLGDCFKK